MSLLRTSSELVDIIICILIQQLPILFPHSLFSFVVINVGANPVLDAGEILSLEYEQK